MLTDHTLSSPKKITVLIVDDSAFMRTIIGDILQADPETEVIGEAADGLEALELIAKLQPDVITLDLVMPKMNGFAVLERIAMKEQQPAALVISAYTKQDAEITLDCLTMGAVDFILKPSDSSPDLLSKIGPELIAKIKIAAQVGQKRRAALQSAAHPTEKTNQYGVLAIGSSTGGPVALEQLLPHLPKDLPYPVLVAQHLPAQFVEALASRLAQASQLEVKAGQNGDIVHAGAVYFMPGGANTEVVKNPAGDVQLVVTPANDILTPSVDMLMTSVAREYGSAAQGLILTGMGEDGLAGMKAIKAAGGRTLVQERRKFRWCLVWAGRLLNTVWPTKLLPLNHLAQRIR